MKVLHINYTDHEGAGGAGVSTYRLHMGLRKAGVDSKILSRLKTLKSDDSEQIKKRVLEYLIRPVSSRLGFNDLEGVASFSVHRNRLFKEADIVNIHCIHSGYFNYLALPKITRLKPTVWSPHDVWPLTGNCALWLDCMRWKTGCGHCPHPDSYPPMRRDGSAVGWRLKNWAYSRSNLHFIVTSRWFVEVTQQSMLKRFPIHQVPWGVDTEVFKPLDQRHCRSVLGIPQDKKVLMFGAVNSKLSNKGGDLLIKALEILPVSLKKDLVLLTMGHRTEQVFERLKIPMVHAGYVSNDHFKAIVYSAADLYLLPTRFETFSIVCIESMGCGTPVVSFDIGPVPELVRHGRTGYAAMFESAEDLAHGTEELLRDETAFQAMRKRCRDMVVNEYNEELQTKRYIEVYKKVLSS